MTRADRNRWFPSFSGCREAARTGGSAAPVKRAPLPGFTLIEAVLSILMVGLLLVAAMTTLGAVGTSRLTLVEQERGRAFAESMLAEIVDLPYTDQTTPAAFGPEAGEASGGGRSGFDDVDDYHGWSATPLQWRDGAAVTDTTGWTREVVVARVDPDNLAQVSVTDLGAKRITVTVKRGGKVTATLTAIRTEAR